MEKRTAHELPAFFKQILWSYDFEKIDTEKHASVIILQAINYGTLAHWRWIKKHYGEEKIQKVITEIPATDFRPQALRLASILFKTHTTNHASRSTHQ